MCRSEHLIIIKSGVTWNTGIFLHNFEPIHEYLVWQTCSEIGQSKGLFYENGFHVELFKDMETIVFVSSMRLEWYT